MRIRLFPLSILVAMSGTIAAQTYPSQPVRVVVPFAPGGVSDLVLNSFSATLAKKLGQPVVMDNRAGAGGAVAAGYVARANPDGHVLMLGTGGNLAIAPHLFKSLPYNVETDFASIAMIARGQFMLVTHPSVPVGSVGDLVRLAKERSDQIRYGSSGVGSPPHLAAELFKALAGVSVLHVPYKGSNPMLTDLIGGHVDIAFDSIATSLPHVQSKRLRAIAVTGEQRAAAAPGLPTIAESGLPTYKAASFYAVVAPAATPKEIVDRLTREILALAASDDVKRKLVSYGLDPVAIGGNEMNEALKRERSAWSMAIKAARIEPQ